MLEINCQYCDFLIFSAPETHFEYFFTFVQFTVCVLAHSPSWSVILLAEHDANFTTWYCDTHFPCRRWQLCGVESPRPKREAV